jgi:nitrous oxidase accessory protein NosD
MHFDLKFKQTEPHLFSVTKDKGKFNILLFGAVVKRTALALTLILALSFPAVAGVWFVKPAIAQTIIVPDDHSTIQDAINAAHEGDTIFVRKGTYEGAENQTLMINKTISLIGENAKTTKINMHPEWVTSTIFTTTISGYAFPIRIEANDVRLSGFTITSDGGQLWVGANRTQITDNIITIHLQVNNGLTIITDYTTIARNTLTHGLSLVGSYSTVVANNFSRTNMGVSGSFNVVYGNIIDGATNSLVGIGLGDGHGNMVVNNTITNCKTGILIGGVQGVDNIICTNRIVDNNEGVAVTDHANNNNFYANYIANNQIGATVGYKIFLETINTFYHNNFVNNAQQVNTNDALYHNGLFDDGKEGNYWSDYSGSDANGDGIGDAPYVIDANRSDHYPLVAPFDIFNVVIQLPEWTSRSPKSYSFPAPKESPSMSPSPPPTQIPFPITLVATAFGASIAVIVVGLLVYFKKRKHKAEITTE